MTSQEKNIKRLISEFFFRNLRGSELNSIIDVKEAIDGLQIDYEDGTKQLVSITITEIDE